LNIGGGSQVAGGLGALAAGGNAIRIAIELKQSMGEAGAQLMEEYMNATGGPGGYVQTTANENGYVWDPNPTSDTPGFIEPGKWVYIDESGECLYYTNEADIKLATYDLPEGCEIPYRRTAFDKLKGWASNISVADVGHFVLDIVGTLPIVGMAADLINAGWYAAEGDYKTAALSAGAIFGGSALLLVSKYGGRVASRVAKVSDEVAAGVSKPRFIVDSAGNVLDTKVFEGLTEVTVVTKGARGGTQLPLVGTPGTYADLGNGHKMIYGSDGKAIFDVSTERIKAIEWHIAPDGTAYPKKGSDTKYFIDNVPIEILNALGF
jgi:hypothetical protein